MNLTVGMKWGAIAAVVLVVISTSFYTIRYIQKSTEDSIVISLQEETLERRDAIKDAVENSVGSRAPRDDASDSLRWLRDRQSAQ